jgi:hypothetical protein
MLHDTAIRRDAIPSAAIPSAAIPSAAIPSAAIPSAAIPSAAIPSAAIPSAAIPSAAIKAAGAWPASLARTGAVIRHNTILLLREPGPLASRLIMPLLFLTLLHPLYQVAERPGAGIGQAVIATLVTFSLLGLSIVGSSILVERTRM